MTAETAGPLATSADDVQHSEVDGSLSLLVNLGNAVDLTLGEGGTGSESMRYECN